jgi:hypothetical protein
MMLACVRVRAVVGVALRTLSADHLLVVVVMLLVLVAAAAAAARRRDVLQQPQ